MHVKPVFRRGRSLALYCAVVIIMAAIAGAGAGLAGAVAPNPPPGPATEDSAPLPAGDSHGEAEGPDDSVDGASPSPVEDGTEPDDSVTAPAPEGPETDPGAPPPAESSPGVPPLLPAAEAAKPGVRSATAAPGFVKVGGPDAPAAEADIRPRSTTKLSLGSAKRFARRAARGASHGGFSACHGVQPADREACERLLSELAAEEASACPEARRLDPACRAASVRFSIEAACIDRPDRDACRERLRDNPCFENPLSNACDRFLVTADVLACRGDASEIIPFRCRVIAGALELFCLEHEAAGIPVDKRRCPAAGGGLNREGRPGRGLAAGRSTLVALSDAGTRGDLGISDLPAGRTKPRPRRGTLARTGSAPFALLLVGVLTLAGGAAMMRRARRA